MGNAVETEVIRRLKESGLEVLTARKNFKIDKPHISGREDIMVQDPETGELYPCEIKGLSPLTWDKIDTVEDMLSHKAYYVRKYPAQLQIYMYAHNKEKGFFILFNKISGAIKVIDVALDYEYVESLLQKTEAIYKHIADKTLPEPIEDEHVCGDCPLLHICGAKINRGETVIDTGELEELLKRREELQPLAKEFDGIKEQIKAVIGEADKVFTASYMVENRTVFRKGYAVPESTYFRQLIRKIG